MVRTGKWNELTLSYRALGVLSASYIGDVETLCRMTPKLLSQYKNCGRVTVHEIECALAQIGKSLTHVTRPRGEWLSKYEEDLREEIGDREYAFEQAEQKERAMVVQ
jgi:hypothetical protein